MPDRMRMTDADYLEHDERQAALWLAGATPTTRDEHESFARSYVSDEFVDRWIAEHQDDPTWRHHEPEPDYDRDEPDSRTEHDWSL